MATEVTHDGPRRAVGRLADVLVPVAKTEEEIGKKMDDVRFEQPPQRVTETLKREERSLAMSVVLLVLDGVLQRRHHSVLLQGGNTETFDQPGESVCRSASLAVAGRFQKLLQEF